MPLAASLAPPTKPLPPSTSEIYLDAKLIIVFYLPFVIRCVLFLPANTSPAETHKCFFPKVSYFPIQSNYTCDVALKQSLSHSNSSEYHNEILDEKILYALYRHVFFITAFWAFKTNIFLHFRHCIKKLFKFL